MAAVAARFGGIDVLINNAGTIQVGPLQNQDVSDFEEAMNLHFWGNFHLIWESLPHLRSERRGADRQRRVHRRPDRRAAPRAV